MSNLSPLVTSHTNIIILGWLTFIFTLERMSKRFPLPTIIKEKGLDRWCKNIILGLINRFLLPLITFPIAIYASSHAFVCRPLWLQGIVGVVLDIIILDLASYGFHRLCHKFPILWRLHEVHHLDSAFDVTTGLRIHFGELFIANLFRAIPIMLFAIPLKSVVIFELILVMQGLFHHSNIKIPTILNTLLSFIIVTPDRHSVHHHAKRPDTDSNYGFIFIVWDKVFKTFNKSNRLNSWRMGLEYSSDVSLIKLIFPPFNLKEYQIRLKKRQ